MDSSRTPPWRAGLLIAAVVVLEILVIISSVGSRESTGPNTGSSRLAGTDLAGTDRAGTDTVSESSSGTAEAQVQAALREDALAEQEVMDAVARLDELKKGVADLPQPKARKKLALASRLPIEVAAPTEPGLGPPPGAADSSRAVAGQGAEVWDAAGGQSAVGFVAAAAAANPPDDGAACYKKATAPTAAPTDAEHFYVRQVHGGTTYKIDVGADYCKLPGITGETDTFDIIPGPGQKVAFRRDSASYAISYGRLVVDQVYGPFPGPPGGQLEVRAWKSTEYLRTFGSCRGCDLRGASIAGVTFSAGTDFSKADLSGASLYNLRFPDGASFEGAYFGIYAGRPTSFTDVVANGASFQWAVFEGSRLSDTKFLNAALAGMVIKDATLDSSVVMTRSDATDRRVVFKNSVVVFPGFSPWQNVRFDDVAFVVESTYLKQLSERDASECDAPTAVAPSEPPDARCLKRSEALRGSTISDVTISNKTRFLGGSPDLSNTVWTGADISGSDFSTVDLSGADMSKIKAEHTYFSGAALINTNMSNADLHGSNFSDAVITDAQFNGAMLGKGAELDDDEADLSRVYARGATFEGADLRYTDFSRSYLFPTVLFRGAQASNANFESASLAEADFSDANLDSANFTQAQCISCIFSKTNARNANFTRGYLFGTDFSNAVLKGANFGNSALNSQGLWTFKAGLGALPPEIVYKETSANNRGMISVSKCPDGGKPSPTAGCGGSKEAPFQPPPPPACYSAGGYLCDEAINTLVGTGRQGLNWATTAPKILLNKPTRVIADTRVRANGRGILIADTGNNVVRAVDRLTGESTVIAGMLPPIPSDCVVAGIVLEVCTITAEPISGDAGDGGQATDAKLSGPTGLAIDNQGQIYIADTGNHRIRRVSTTGVIETIAGTGTPGKSGDGKRAGKSMLDKPRGVAAACGTSSCSIYIADTGNNRITVIKADGKMHTVAGTGKAGYKGKNVSGKLAELDQPQGVAVDTRGNTFIADTGNNKIRIVGPTGLIKDYKPTLGKLFEYQLDKPTDIALDRRGFMYIADSGANRIARAAPPKGGDKPGALVNGQGKPGFSGDSGSALGAQLSGASGVDRAITGFTVIADTGNNRIRIIG